MKFFTCDSNQSWTSIEGSDFIIGLPSNGNIGLMALDVVISTIHKLTSNNQLQLIGYGETEFLLPMVGYDSFGSNENTLLYPLEFYRINGSSTILVMTRSISRENEEKFFAEEIIEFLRSQKYASVLFLTGASPDDWDLNVMMQKSRCFSFRKRNDTTDKFLTLLESTYSIEEGIPTDINQSNQEFPFGMEIAALAFRSLSDRVAILGQFCLGDVQPFDITMLIMPHLLFSHSQYFSHLFSSSLQIQDLQIPLSWKLMQESSKPSDLFPVW